MYLRDLPPDIAAFTSRSLQEHTKVLRVSVGVWSPPVGPDAEPAHFLDHGTYFFTRHWAWKVWRDARMAVRWGNRLPLDDPTTCNVFLRGIQSQDESRIFICTNAPAWDPETIERNLQARRRPPPRRPAAPRPAAPRPRRPVSDAALPTPPPVADARAPRLP